MRLVNINAPEGFGIKVIEIAHELDITDVSMYKVERHLKGQGVKQQDVVVVKSSTPKTKKFVDAVLDSSFYDVKNFSFAVREPRSIISSEDIREITYPIIVPDVDVYQELWQFSQITFSYLGRTLFSSALLSYGMIKMNLLVIVAALMFLPFLHPMLTTAFGLGAREWAIFKQGLKAILTSAILTIISGVIIALILKEPLRFQEFSSPLTGFLMALIIGIAAGVGTADDAGRKELLGLAITSQTTIYIAWFGISLIIGFPLAEKTNSNILSFFINMCTIIISGAFTYYFLKMGGATFKNFLSKRAKSG